MNKIKLFIIAAIATVLVGCGGHDYEGSWKLEGGVMGFNVAAGTMVIGSDYIEMDGVRTEVDVITRTSGADKYLVLVDKDTGADIEAYKIVDNNTMTMEQGMAVMTLTRMQQ